MSREQMTVFLQQHWNWVTLILGIILLIGAILNWNWLCNPVGKPDSHRYGQNFRRMIFSLLGVLLMIVSIWRIATALQ